MSESLASNSLGVAGAYLQKQASQSHFLANSTELDEQRQLDIICKYTDPKQTLTQKEQNIFDNIIVPMQKKALGRYSGLSESDSSSQLGKFTSSSSSSSSLTLPETLPETLPGTSVDGDPQEQLPSGNVIWTYAPDGPFKIDLSNVEDHPAYNLCKPGTFIDAFILKAWAANLQKNRPDLLIAEPTRLSQSFIDEVVEKNADKLVNGQWLYVPLNCHSNHQAGAERNQSGNHWILFAIRYHESPQNREFLVFDSMQTRAALKNELQSLINQHQTSSRVKTVKKAKFISGNLQDKYPNGCGVLVAGALHELALAKFGQNPDDVLSSFHRQVFQSNQKSSQQTVSGYDLAFRNQLQSSFDQWQSDIQKQASLQE